MWYHEAMAKLTNKVTRAEIFAAADEIAAAGGKLTLEAIRQRVGGSFTTLSPAFRAWQEQREAEAKAATPPGGSLPDTLQSQLAELGARLWAEAARQADDRLQTERDEVQAERQKLAEESRSIAETADRLARQVDELQARCAKLDEGAGRLRADLETARQDSTQAAAQAAADRQLADELREQLAATRQSLCAGLAGRVEALERTREG